MELDHIVQKEIEAILDERVELIAALQGLVDCMELDVAAMMEHELDCDNDPETCTLCKARAVLAKVASEPVQSEKEEREDFLERCAEGDPYSFEQAENGRGPA